MKAAFTFVASLCYFSAFVQQIQFKSIKDPNGIIRCATMERDSIRRSQNPLLPSLQQTEKWLQTKIKDYQKQQTILQKNGGIEKLIVLKIPVVVHVIHNGDAYGSEENIRDEQVLSQIQVLNEDFRRMMGTPGYNTSSVGADVEVEFCMAQIDPNGNSTNGIDRVNTGVSSYTTMAEIDGTLKPATIWNPDNYLNMWTMRFSGDMAGTLGYAQFPDASGLQGLSTNGGAANSDGVVASFDAFGSSAIYPAGNYNPTYNLGRTMTHEVGHWLGLRHIWGDGDCTVDDFCNDTPLSDAANFGCPVTNSCTDPAPDVNDMVANYMDYTDDNCMNIFTQNQKDRIRTVLSFSPRRASLPNSYVTICNPGPMVYFTNQSATSVTEGTSCGYKEVTVNLAIGDAPSANAVATFNLQALTSATQGVDFDIIPASVTFLAGQVQPKLVTLRIYEDGHIENDEIIQLSFTLNTTGNAFSASNGTETISLSILNDDFSSPSQVFFSENFENGLGAFTTLGNTGSDLFKVGTTSAANSTYLKFNISNGTKFAYTNDDACNCNKANDRLTSPSIDLSNKSNVLLSFDHAFSNQNGESATVWIRSSSNNGATWTAYSQLLTLANPNSTINGSGVVSAGWNNQQINLNAYLGKLIQIRFIYNDGGAWKYGLAIDNFTMSCDQNIQTLVNVSQPKNIQIKPFNYLIYNDVVSSNRMIALSSLSNWDYGCTSVSVDRDVPTNVSYSKNFWSTNASYNVAAKTYLITPTTNLSNGSYEITLYYTEAEIAGWEAETGRSRTELEMIKVSGNSINAVTPSNFANYSIESKPATLSTFNSGGVALKATFNSGFSGFGIGVLGAIPLPIQLVDFSGEGLAIKNKLTWTTINERNNEEFRLQKSNDGIEFTTIGQLPGAGNSNTTLQYEFDDFEIGESMNYYRLIQRDFDGSETISDTISIQRNGVDDVNYSISPNPTDKLFYLSSKNSHKTNANITIVDQHGKIVNQTIWEKEQPMLELNAENWSRGIYFIEIEGVNKVVLRFVKP